MARTVHTTAHSRAAQRASRISREVGGRASAQVIGLFDDRRDGPADPDRTGDGLPWDVPDPATVTPPTGDPAAPGRGEGAPRASEPPVARPGEPAVTSDPPSDPWGVAPRRPPTTMLRAAVRPRMIVLLVVLLGAAYVCGRLGAWQLDRAQIRGAGAEAKHVAAQMAAPAVPIDEVIAPQTSFRGDAVGRKVSAVGTYDADAQLLVPDRALDDRTGYLILTPLRTADGVLPVVRAWIPTPDLASAPPAGTVTVTGYLQASEQAGSGITDGRTDAISSAELIGTWGGPIWTGYLVLASSDPPQPADLALLGLPRAPGQGLNIQNLAYAAQWWIFGSFAVLLWLRLVRDEARGDADDVTLDGEQGVEPTTD